MPRYIVHVPLGVTFEVNAETPDIAGRWATERFGEVQPTDPLAEVQLKDAKIGDDKVDGIVVKTAILLDTERTTVREV